MNETVKTGWTDFSGSGLPSFFIQKFHATQHANSTQPYKTAECQKHKQFFLSIKFYISYLDVFKRVQTVVTCLNK